MKALLLMAFATPSVCLSFGPGLSGPPRLLSRPQLRLGAPVCSEGDPETPPLRDTPVGALITAALGPGGEGRRIAWGALTQEVDQAAVPDAAEREARRARAATNLMNIDDEERARRQTAGSALSLLTAVFAAALLATHADAATRLAILPPVYLSVGYLASAKEGL